MNWRKRGRISAFGAACMVASVVSVTAPSASAAAYTVTTFNDTYDGNCTASDCSLRDAIAAANADGNGVITLPAGGYSLTRGSFADNDDPATGDLDVSGAFVSIAGPPNGFAEIDVAGMQVDGLLTGGRVFDLMPGSQLSISNVNLSGGVADLGGGIQSAGFLILNEVLVGGNEASVSGGGIHVSAGSVSVVDSWINSNIAPDGGGISMGDPTGGGPFASVERSLINHNVATLDFGGSGNGGGILSDGGNLAIFNSTISNNRADGAGGAAFLQGTFVDADFATIAMNIATGAGAAGMEVGAGASFDAMHTIVSHAAGDDCGVNGGAVNSLGFNLESATSCGFTSFDGTDLQNTDPLLGDLADHGGATLSHMPGVGSPAIDGGDPSMDEFATSCTGTDQRGVNRPQQQACDIGAVEVKTGEAGSGGADVPACSDFKDNDGDGYFDYPYDPGCDSPEDDSEAGGGSEEPVGRSLDFKLRRHLKAKGQLFSEGIDNCYIGHTIKIQKRKAGKWKTIRKTQTDGLGKFKKRLPDRRGKYRARVGKARRQAGDTTYLCGNAKSRARRHRH